MNVWKLWMRAATPDEQELMAQAIGTTRGMLYQYSSPESTQRYPAPERAAAIEKQAAKMHRASLGRLPLIYRTDLNEACRACDFAQRCLGPAAVRADFPIVTPEMVAETGGADGK